MANKKNTKNKKVVNKKKNKKTVSPKVIINIKATYNNTIASASDYEGNVIAVSSCGALGFTGSRKSTVYAATKVGEDIATKAMNAGAREAEVVIKGIGVGRQATVKGIRSAGLKISVLLDKTPVPHGGVKPRKAPKK
ncbi:MAG: 30S ribosomal protein S11 [Candidatus Dojkabacteria bacterium]|nr:MAG: 30S ribosomal protein S11 [Candidatus Dojkabacteria bacterium]